MNHPIDRSVAAASPGHLLSPSHRPLIATSLALLLAVLASCDAPHQEQGTGRDTESAAALEPSERKGGDPLAGQSIQSLDDLNRLAMDRDGVMVFLPGNDRDRNADVVGMLENAANSLRRSGIDVGLFTIASQAVDYSRLQRQVPPPGVLVLVKGRGMSAVSRDISESNLVQAYVSASSPGGCGPSGCAPR